RRRRCASGRRGSTASTSGSSCRRSGRATSPRAPARGSRRERRSPWPGSGAPVTPTSSSSPPPPPPPRPPPPRPLASPPPPRPRREPLRRPALRTPAHDERAHPSRRGVQADRRTRRRARGSRCAPGARPRRAGALPAAERLLRPRRRAEVDVKRPVAVVGVGQTHHSSRRADLSIAGLVREAVDRALLDAGLDYGDIDAVVVGKAPDQLEGVMQPEQFLAGALGAHLKPLVRVHTAGSVGASTALTAVTHVGSGLFDRVLAVAWEKQ